MDINSPAGVPLAVPSPQLPVPAELIAIKRPEQIAANKIFRSDFRCIIFIGRARLPAIVPITGNRAVDYIELLFIGNKGYAELATACVRTSSFISRFGS